MKQIKNPVVFTALVTLAILLLYFAMVANQVVTLLAGDGVSQVLGVVLIVLPLIGVAFVVRGWRLGNATQRMAAVLTSEGRLPVHDGETLPNGHLTDSVADAVFEVARRAIEDRPDDWRAWFHVAYAYAAVGDRRMARKALGHAAGLFRRERVRG